MNYAKENHVTIKLGFSTSMNRLQIHFFEIDVVHNEFSPNDLMPKWPRATVKSLPFGYC